MLMDLLKQRNWGTDQDIETRIKSTSCGPVRFNIIPWRAPSLDSY